MHRSQARRTILALLLGTLMAAGAATWHGGNVALPTVSSSPHVIAGGGNPIFPS
jgi:hypothetical protein